MKKLHTFETFVPKNTSEREKKLQALKEKKLAELKKKMLDPKFKSTLEYSLQSNDFDDALVDLQNYIGQHYGDFAAMYFNGDHMRKKWPTLSKSSRLKVLSDYMVAEFVEELHSDQITEKEAREIVVAATADF